MQSFDPGRLDARERRLLDCATSLGSPRRLPELVESLRPAFELDPEPTVAGLAVLDEERGLVAYHPHAPGAIAHVPSDRSALRLVEPGRREALAIAPGEAGEDDFLRALGRRGVARFVLAPLYFDRRRLGCVFAGERAGATILELERYLEALARIVEPRVANAFTDERFARGDKRRDALVELARVLNASLEPTAVLRDALEALARIEGHAASWIGLVDEAGASWTRYERGSEPATLAIEASVLARLLGDPRTFESDELARAAPHRGDLELRARGVRRYVATPLAAGGRVLGALLFGSDDPHPPLRMDVWLLENVALQLALALSNARSHEALRRVSARREREAAYLREELASEHGPRGMIGRSPAMRALFGRIERVARTDSTVLVSGPTGVGKELVARAIHEASRAKERPMVKLNCAAIPEGMVESELFGHERGAFTSAVDRRVGRFELAHESTLFLDEVGELPLGVQAKLLRVLQSGEFERVGGARTLRSSARIVAATNRDLAKAVESGSFRSDLYYRLDVFPIEVPPLDARREDVPLLAASFVEELARRMGKRIEGIEERSLEALCARSWPGNVRELRHVIERAVILCDGPLLEIEAAEPLRARGEAEPSAEASSMRLTEVEAAHIRTALARTAGRIEGERGAAALLGLAPSTLRFRMKRLGVRRPEAG